MQFEFSDEIKNNIIENLLIQAKVYLEDADEFYPYGTVIDSKQRLKLVSSYLGEEYPNPNDVLNRLEGAFIHGIITGDYLAAGIGVDVFIRVQNEKISAVEIRLYNNGGMLKQHYKYVKQGAEYVFEECSPD